MNTKTENFQAQFSGFYNTPHLFKSPVFGMSPFVKTLKKQPTYNALIKPNVRLGQRVEQFVFEELKLFETFSVLAENKQIQNHNNQTLGELDCLFLDKEQPVHLEIQFKYYIYDDTLGSTEIDHCIGPMRRDSLVEKLNKLKNKQLPLLYANETKPLLELLNLKTEDFIQQLYFKAQIFVPYGKQIKFKTLNKTCVYGFYFNYKQLHVFKDCKFYIPKKMDWLLDVNTNVNWQTSNQIQPELAVFETENYSPLLWLKFPNGKITKCFVVAH